MIGNLSWTSLVFCVDGNLKLGAGGLIRYETAAEPISVLISLDWMERPAPARLIEKVHKLMDG